MNNRELRTVLHASIVLFSCLVLFCLCYYCGVYIKNSRILIEASNILTFVVFSISNLLLCIVSLIGVFFNTKSIKRIESLTKENIELSETILALNMEYENGNKEFRKEVIEKLKENSHA